MNSNYIARLGHSAANDQITATTLSNHPVRILILYGSLREESYSKKLAQESAKILQSFGAEVKVFDPRGLPVHDAALVDNAKVQELRALALWSEGMLWSSPEIHGNMSAVFKNQIDWIPLSLGSVRPTQGRTLALMQVSGGSQSFNVVNNMRLLGRWMRMFTIPNQSSIPKAHEQFDQQGRLIDSPFKDRVIDVLEELFKMTILLRDHKGWLTQRHSESKQLDENVAAISQEVQLQQTACCKSC